MTGLSDILANQPRPPVNPKTPAGWDPGVSYDGTTATVTLPAAAGEPDAASWAVFIADWNLDPDILEMVDGSLEFRGWDANVGDGKIERLRYYKARFRRRDTDTVRADIDELIRHAAKAKAPKRGAIDTEHPAMVVSLNDWQLGKGEGGGTVTTLDRLLASFAAVRARLKELTRLGRRPSSVVLANTGDLVEQTAGHYASQTFTVDLNLREQCRLARRVLFRMVDELVSDGYPVLVTAAPCNHGENRNGAGKALTAVDDNLSLTIVEGVEEACAVNPERYGAVTFAYAKDLTMVIDVCGVNVGLTHGHQIRGSGGATSKVERWWAGQIMGAQPIASADLLLTAHLHHLNVSEESGRTVIIAPAMDGGSYWYTSATGKTSPPGMLTLTVGDAHPRGWSDLAVL